MIRSEHPLRVGKEDAGHYQHGRLIDQLEVVVLRLLERQVTRSVAHLGETHKHLDLQLGPRTHSEEDEAQTEDQAPQEEVHEVVIGFRDIRLHILVHRPIPDVEL